ncbi:MULTISPECIES: phosphatase [Virgibacillus]|nr:MULTISPECIES: phosphatase [Virgibacillus]
MMKKTYIGGILILVSAIIYGSMLISASIYSETLTTEGVGWDSEYGIFGTALKEIGNTPIIISILSGILGVIFIVLSLRIKGEN